MNANAIIPLRRAVFALASALLLTVASGHAGLAASTAPGAVDYGRLEMDLSAYPPGSVLVSRYALHSGASLAAFQIVGNSNLVFTPHHYRGGIVQTVQLPARKARFVAVEVDVFAHVADAQYCYDWVSDKTGWLSDRRDHVAVLPNIRPWSSGYSLIYSGTEGQGAQEYAWMRLSNILVTIRENSGGLTRDDLPPMTRDIIYLGHLLAGHIAHLQMLGYYHPAG